KRSWQSWPSWTEAEADHVSLHCSLSGEQPGRWLARGTPGRVRTLSPVRGSGCHPLAFLPDFKMLSLKLPRLLSIEQMPEVFHEQGIVFGYRHPQSSATACVLSLFQMTNETLNIWTHLLPFWFFMWKFVSMLCVTDVQDDSYSWPLLVYMGTSCVYPLASSCAHTFSSMSSNARHICYFLDYGAVNLFSLGSAIAYGAYAFPDALVRSTFHDCYVTLAVLNTVLSTGLSCYSRLGFAAGEAGSLVPGETLYQAGRNVVSSRRKSMLWGMALTSQSQLSSCLAICAAAAPSPGWAQASAIMLSGRICLSLPPSAPLIIMLAPSVFGFLEIKKPRLSKMLRVLAFAYPYTWDSIPIFCRLFLFPGESAQHEATLCHQRHMAMTLLASFFYSAHVPERLAPGCFDYIGESSLYRIPEPNLQKKET
ncbi:hypothetical protein MC885_015456, partial [Smutsia gigantea]